MLFEEDSLPRSRETSNPVEDLSFSWSDEAMRVSSGLSVAMIFNPDASVNAPVWVCNETGCGMRAGDWGWDVVGATWVQDVSEKSRQVSASVKFFICKIEFVTS